VGVTCSVCHVLRANLSKPDSCELSNCRDESHVASNAAPFFGERSFIQVQWISLSQNSRCSFWYHLGVCWQHKSRSDSTWS
jgi:hypothetical protein